MSRMDRYKHIHEQSEKTEEKSGFNPRKQKKNQQIESLVSNEKQPEVTRKSPKFFNKNKKIQKKKSAKRWLKRGLLSVLLLLVIAFAFFLKGKFYAENDTSLSKEETEVFNGVKSSNGTSNILILGSDTRGEDAGRADTIMVLQLDGPSKKPKLISFMRDTFVDIPGYDANKINASYALGGAELVRQTLVENFNIECKYYAKVDFQSFEKIIDAMFPNGVKLEAEKDLDLDGVVISQGVQKMDGHTLLQYARFRMDEEGDFGRVRRQQQVMEAVMSQLKNPFSLIRAPESLGRFVGYISTDIPTSFMLKNSWSLLKGGSGIERLTIPVENSWEYADYYYAGSVLQINEEMNQQAIANFLNQ